MFLSDEELQQLTGKKRRNAQATELNHLGIDHKRRADGSIVVLRAAVEWALGLRQERKAARPVEPNWEAINK